MIFFILESSSELPLKINKQFQNIKSPKWYLVVWKLVQYGAFNEGDIDFLYNVAVLSDNMQMLKTVNYCKKPFVYYFQLAESRKFLAFSGLIKEGNASPISQAALYNRVQALAYLLVRRPLNSPRNLQDYFPLTVTQILSFLTLFRVQNLRFFYFCVWPIQWTKLTKELQE
jgi:hypothetical protein